jgi:hypothetical protein
LQAICVSEAGSRLSFSFEDVLRHHGGSSPGGVALAFRALGRALPLLAPEGVCERRSLVVRSAFGGPGARDAFELVGRFHLDETLREPRLGPARERFVFVVEHAARAVRLTLREGFVTDEFAELAFASSRDDRQNARLEVLKAELAERVLAQPPEDVFDAESTPASESLASR